jgi:hypothetical protein
VKRSRRTPPDTRRALAPLTLLASIIASVGLLAGPAAAAPASNAAVRGVLPAPTLDQAPGGPAGTTLSGNWVRLGLYEIINSQTGRCLDAFWENPWGRPNHGANGNPIGLWDCNGGGTERWWVWLDDSRTDWNYKFVNLQSGRCLDYPASSGGANGSQYQLWDCVPSAGQWFRYSAHNPYRGGRLISVELGGPNNHIDAFWENNWGMPQHGANGNPVGNWAWTDSPLQHWRFNKVG